MDPDKPVDGDPPIDAMSMLEVIGDSRTSAEARMMAARDMMAPYAIRAILDGANPVQVAEACGFGGSPKQPRIQSMTDVMQQMITGQVFFEPGVEITVEASSSNANVDITAFTQWITRKLAAIIGGDS